MTKNNRPLFSLTVAEFFELYENEIVSGPRETKRKSKAEMDDKIYLAVDEAAEFLKISKSTLYTMTSQQKIPHIKRYKKVYFKKSELIAWLEQGKVEQI